jgi:hypothetical protein
VVDDIFFLVVEIRKKLVHFFYLHSLGRKVVFVVLVMQFLRVLQVYLKDTTIVPPLFQLLTTHPFEVHDG